MARGDSVFVCKACGAIQAKWAGQCPACQEWNTLAEEAPAAPVARGAPSAAASGRKAGKLEFVPLDGVEPAPPRRRTGIGEFDRVLGGGVVPASAVLIGGDPGIGKSTLLLQAAASLARAGAEVAYISGEESAGQIQDRARRLGAISAPVKLAAETHVRDIIAGLKIAAPDVAIIDSVQTLWSDAVDSPPGSLMQVRAAAQDLVRFAKKSGTAIMLVGHVTKDGQIAGPKVIEHMVDSVLYFEGERGHQFRILRAVKNRFGAADEIGVFDMGESGLREVTNPSALFLGPQGARASGAAVFAGIEGSRPVLVEVQALAGAAALGAPRRAVVGWDPARLAMVLAVLEARGGFSLGNRDVYLSVAGGYRIAEPGADLAAAAALLSSALDTPLPQDSVFFGEIALSGDIRPVGRMDARIKEAAKLGFPRAIAARHEALPREAHGLTHIAGLIEMIGGRGGKRHGS